MYAEHSGKILNCNRTNTNDLNTGYCLWWSIWIRWWCICSYLF